jgi:soluble cytochrome b562
VPAQASPSPAYQALEGVLGQVRRRAWAIHVGAVGAFCLAGFCLVWPLLLAFADRSQVVRGLAMGLPLLTAFVFVLAGPGWFWRRAHQTDWLIGKIEVASARRGLRSAVELNQALQRGDAGFSAELARAHITQVAADVIALDLDEALPRTRQWQGLGALGGGLLVLVLCAALAPRFFSRAFLGLFRAQAEATSLVEKLAEPITYDIELVYKYPDYTGLPAKTVLGTGGEISALAGTQVELKTRADRDVVQASVVVGSQAQPLAVQDKRALSGTLLVRAPGSYRFRFSDKSGSPVAEGPPIPIAVEADQAPKVTLSAPERELEVDPKGTATLRYEASDDYGLASLELVYRVGNAKVEQRVGLLHEKSPRRTSGSYAWQMPTLHLAAGDRVTYWVEAKDGNTVTGPGKGKSREQVLKVYSEAEHHRAALQRVDKLWEKLVVQLADTLEQPDRVARPEPAQVAAGASFDQHAFELVGELHDTAVDLRRDKAIPPELGRTLENIATSLGTTTHALSDSRTAFARQPLSTRLASRAQDQIVELEKDTVYLEKLLDHRRLEDLQALSKELSGMRRDLQGLMEKYQKAPDEQTKVAIQDEVSRMKERIADLMSRMSELQRSIHDEHLNQEAMKQLSEQKSMMGQLDKVQQLIDQGKMDEAMKELQKLGDQMDQLDRGLKNDGQKFDEQQDPELAEKFNKFKEDLKGLTEQERAVEKAARTLRGKSQENFDKELARKGEKFAEQLRAKVAQSKAALDKANPGPGPQRYAEDLQRAEDSLDVLDRALAGKDYEAASDAAAQAAELQQRLAADMKQDSLRARKYPGWPGAADPDALAKAADQANQALPPVREVQKELADLFPKGPQQLSPSEQEAMSKLQSQQQKLQEQARDVQKQMDELGQKAPIFSPGMKADMQGAGKQMQQAQQSMGQRDPAGSALHAGGAGDKLEKLGQAVKDATKGGGKGGQGMLLPSSDSQGEGQEDGEGGHTQDNPEKVELPGQNAGDPDALRKDVMDAMKHSAPARYQDQVKKYYEEIVK